MTDAALMKPPTTSLVVRFANRFGLEPSRMMGTLKATCFKTEEPVSDEQMASLLIVAEQYNLNPFTRELFAFVDKKSGGIVPYVSVDGWSRIVNEHPQFDGMDFASDDPLKCTCTMYRKDRAHPITITEYLAECKRGSSAWSLTPRRMLRHRAMTQAARYAFGFALYDEEEARTVVQLGQVERVEPASATAAAVRSVLAPLLPVEEQPEVEPPPRSLASWMDEVIHAANADDAALVVDEARGALQQPELAELGTAYRTKWQPQE